MKTKKENSNKNRVENNKIYIWIFIIFIPLCGAIGGLWKFKCEIFGCPECYSESITFNNSANIKSEQQNLKKALSKEFDFSNIIDSTSSHNKLSKYYQAKNQTIFQKISTTQTYLNFIIGHAGSGKSLVYREINSILPKEQFNVIKISLSKQCKCSDNTCNGWVSKEQLRTTSSEYIKTFSSLPLNSKLSIQNLLKDNQIKYEKSKQNILFIDDCDEIHPVAITNLIHSISDLNNSNKSYKWKYFLIGRAEAFRNYFTQTHKVSAANYERHYLANPTYRTSGDIKFRIHNYYEFENKEIDTLLVYERFLNSSDSMKAFVKKQLSDLQCGNFIIAEFNKSNIKNLDSLKRLLYYSYLKRAKQTHCRPAENDKLYNGLLRQVALNYSSKTDDNGFFLVTSNDEVSVQFCDNKIQKFVSVKVQDLLEFSGIVDMKPITDNHTYYKFTPQWIHELLINN